MPKSTRQWTFTHLLLWSTLIVGLSLGLLAFTWLITLPDVGTLPRNNPMWATLMESRLARAPSADA